MGVGWAKAKQDRAAAAAFAQKAERFRRKGDAERAAEICRDGLAKFPEHLSGRVTLGWALIDLGRHDEARGELESVLRRAPDNLAAIRGLATLHDRSESAMLDIDMPEGWHDGELVTGAGREQAHAPEPEPEFHHPQDSDDGDDADDTDPIVVDDVVPELITNAEAALGTGPSAVAGGTADALMGDVGPDDLDSVLAGLEADLDDAARRDAELVTEPLQDVAADVVGEPAETPFDDAVAEPVAEALDGPVELADPVADADQAAADEEAATAAAALADAAEAAADEERQAVAAREAALEAERQAADAAREAARLAEEAAAIEAAELQQAAQADSSQAEALALADFGEEPTPDQPEVHAAPAAEAPASAAPSLDLSEAVAAFADAQADAVDVRGAALAAHADEAARPGAAAAAHTDDAPLADLDSPLLNASDTDDLEQVAAALADADDVVEAPDVDLVALEPADAPDAALFAQFAADDRDDHDEPAPAAAGASQADRDRDLEAALAEAHEESDLAEQIAAFADLDAPEGPAATPAASVEAELPGIETASLASDADDWTPPTPDLSAVPRPVLKMRIAESDAPQAPVESQAAPLDARAQKVANLEAFLARVRARRLRRAAESVA